MIKRTVLILLILFAAYSLAAEEMDMIVLLDVSESMFPYFDDTVNFLLKDIVDEHLEFGDGFHLLSFASVPEREIYRVIKSKKDMEAVLARIMLLHPLGKYTDLLSALNYLYDYVSELPLSTSKNILILTDGIHDPPPGSGFPADTEAERQANKEEVVRISTALKRQGWKVRLIQFPRVTADSQSGSDATQNGAAAASGEQPASSGQDQGTAAKSEAGGSAKEKDDNDLFPKMSETLGVDVIKYKNDNNISHTATGAPSLEFPGDLGTVGPSFTVPFKVTNFAEDSILVKLQEVRTHGVNILQDPVQLKLGKGATGTLNARVSLEDYKPGEYQLDVELVFSDDLRIYPRQGVLYFTLKEASFTWIKIPIIVIVILAAAFVLIFYTIVPLRRHIESNADADTYIGLRRKTENEEAETLAREGIPLSEAVPRRGAPSMPQAGSGRQQGKVPLSQASAGGQATVPAVQNRQARPAGSGKIPLMNVPSHQTGGKIPLSQISSSAHFSASALHPMRKLGHRPIEFRMSGQNPNNGGRNIRWIGKQNRSVGGGSSFFLIFLVKVPERIAEVTFTEKGLQFSPLREEFFPGLTAPIENCIDRPIELHTEHGVFTILFREWISPLEHINRLLHLIDEPGMKKDDEFDE